MSKATNEKLTKARKDKADEFYTSRTDIEQELIHYKDHFNNKTILCNCDDPFESNFYKFFFSNMKSWNIKRLITTSYGTSKIAGGQMNLEQWMGDLKVSDKRHAYVLDIKRDDFPVDDDNAIFNYENAVEFARTHAKRLKGDGDFRSDECLALLDEADIVVTNPPFSLFREYVTTLMEHKKKLLVIGNQNAITYKELFPYIMRNELWLGVSIHSGDREFRVPDSYVCHSPSKRVDEQGNQYVRVSGVRWFTNLEYKERNDEMVLVNSYEKHPEMYPKYDNYDAIDVSKRGDIPKDYFGVMGVPITFLDKYCPTQFEIIGKIDSGKIDDLNIANPVVDGKCRYKRLAIKRINKEEENKEE